MQNVIYQKKTPYQMIQVTRSKNGKRTLWLDGHYQFDEDGEQVYHEFLVGLPAAMLRPLRNVLILGGGDGLAAREALEHPGAKVTNVEIDGEVVNLANTMFADLNAGSLCNERTLLAIGDARKFLKECPADAYDLVAVDFPAATKENLGMLYEPDVREGIFRVLAPGGAVSAQVSEDRALVGMLQKDWEKRVPYTRLLDVKWGLAGQGYLYGFHEKPALRSDPRGVFVGWMAGAVIDRMGRNPDRATLKVSRRLLDSQVA